MSKVNKSEDGSSEFHVKHFYDNEAKCYDKKMVEQFSWEKDSMFINGEVNNLIIGNL